MQQQYRTHDYFEEAKQIRAQQIAQGKPLDTAAWKEILENCLEKDMIARDDAQRLVKYLTPDSVVISPRGRMLTGAQLQQVHDSVESIVQGEPVETVMLEKTPTPSPSTSGTSLAAAASSAPPKQPAVIKIPPAQQREYYKTLRFKPKTQSDYELCLDMAQKQFPGSTIIIHAPSLTPKEDQKCVMQ